MSKKQTQAKTQTIIEIALTEGRTCRFEYSDQTMAKEHYDQFRSQGVIAGQLIKNISIS